MSEQIIPDVELTSDVAVAEPVTIEEPTQETEIVTE